MGQLHYCLGIQVSQDTKKGIITLTQSSYIVSLLSKYHMDTYQGMDTPLPITLKHTTPGHNPASSIFPYTNVLGSIRYLVSCTRPDICFSTNLLSRFLQNPAEIHTQYLKRLLRYLRHTMNIGLSYHRQANPLALIGYSDADWGGDPATLQSTSGYLFLLAGAAISWQSKKQNKVTLSSTEAEYISMTLAMKEGIWLQSLLAETEIFAPKSIFLYCDNMSAITLAQNLKHSEKTKHIAMKLQFIRELVHDGTLQLEHIGTDQQWADFLTKSVHKVKHAESCKQIGLQSP
ncbi:hypothetical protein KP509_02G107600 [Ceratopteris richardii]|uniref:Retrovirus-related Pol polyprotein from transposon TNT 1-94 n=1 Tax=Ceratopteris richardii TaxID=49495 RepID=A0A8T2V9I9_CERRI|nr:hypothetical protein KP509_02G107600 [Ceratopteris richardii]